MFYSRRKKFSVYKDYVANDVLLSDATFEQPNAVADEFKEQRRKENISDILTIDDITNVSDHIVATRRNSPIKRYEPDPNPLTKAKPQKGAVGAKSKKLTNGVNKISLKEGTAMKKGPIRRPTVFDGFKPIGLTIDSEKEIIPLNSNHTSIGSGEIPFIDTKSTQTSIHLSEFQQPPRSTSTPFNNTLLEIQRICPISKSTPLHQRPLGYSTPVFHFTPLEGLSNDSGTDYNQSSILSGLVSNDSPLASKLKVDSLKEEIHKITNRIQNDISLHQERSLNDDLSMGDADASLSYQYDGDMKIEPNSSRSEGTLPNKSILKNQVVTSSSDGPKKRVRIHETASYINPKPLKSLKHKKRRAQEDIPRSGKKVKLLQHVNASTNYEDLLASCGDDKDPIDLILR